MNQEQVVSEEIEKKDAVSKIVEKEEEEANSTESASVFLICDDDVKVCKSLNDACTNLREVASKLSAQDTAMFPYSTVAIRDAARALCVANVTVELALAKLVRNVIRGTKTQGKQPFGVPAMLDMMTATTWLSHINRLHQEHVQGIQAHLDQIIHNVEGREEKMKELFAATVRCQPHNEVAVSRDFEGKKFLCKKCVAEIK